MKVIKHGNLLKTQYECKCINNECGCLFIADYDEVIKRFDKDSKARYRVFAVCPECRFETDNTNIYKS